MRRARLCRLLARLRRDFPDESFLVVRFGDHQPGISNTDLASLARRSRGFAAQAHGVRSALFTTVTPIERVKFRRSTSRRARYADRLLCPTHPGGPPACRRLPDFAAQKKEESLRRCTRVFYPCEAAPRVRRLNRMLTMPGRSRGLSFVAAICGRARHSKTLFLIDGVIARVSGQSSTRKG